MKLYKFCTSFVSIFWLEESKTLLGNRLEVSKKASQRYLSTVVSFLSFRTIWLVECCMWNYLSQWKCPIYLWEGMWIESLFDTVLLFSWHKTCPILTDSDTYFLPSQRLSCLQQRFMNLSGTTDRNTSKQKLIVRDLSRELCLSRSHMGRQ